MKRDYQIREVDMCGNEDVHNFDNLADATNEYNERVALATDEGLAIEFELIEVLQQDETKSNAHKSNMSHDLTTVRPVA